MLPTGSQCDLGEFRRGSQSSSTVSCARPRLMMAFFWLLVVAMSVSTLTPGKNRKSSLRSSHKELLSIGQRLELQRDYVQTFSNSVIPKKIK